MKASTEDAAEMAAAAAGGERKKRKYTRRKQPEAGDLPLPDPKTLKKGDRIKVMW